MKRPQGRIKIGLGLLLSILLLSACQIPKDKQNTRKVIEETLQEGSERNTAIFKASNLQLSQEIKKGVVSSVHATAGQGMGISQKRFDLVADQVPARTFFLSLVEGTPYNITVHPSVEGKISLQLKKITVPEVLETVRNVYGYDFRQTPQGIEVLPATLQTRAFAVNYLDIKRNGTSETQVSAGSLRSSNNGTTNSSDDSSVTVDNNSQTTQNNSKVTTRSQADFWEELRSSVETLVGTAEGRRVAVSPLAGLIVVQAMPDELKRVEEYLQKAELSLNRQVILEAKILEVELNDSFQAGINWALLSGRLSAAQYGGSVAGNPLILGDTFPTLTAKDSIVANITPRQASNNVTANAGAFGGVFALATNYKNLGTFIELLGAQGKVHVLSSPRVSTTNNQKALFKVGTDQFFVTNVSTTTTSSGGGQTTTPSVTFDPFFSGIALDVTPHITSTDEVTLHIHPTISVVEDDTKTVTLGANQVQTYPLAKSNVRESDSMVKARNGEMVIIGGLMQNSNSELQEGIPGLKDLPLFGRLFRHTTHILKKSELVIVVRPIVVKNDTWSEKVDDELERFKKLDEEIIKDENRYHCNGPHCYR